MPHKLIQKIAFRLYNLVWSCSLPWLRLNHRLAEGFNQRTLKRGLPAADLWIQAASVGESFLALELIKSLKINKPSNILVTTNTSQAFDILHHSLRNQKIDSNQFRVHIGYFPFDKPAIMQAAVADIHPKVMVLLETGIWPGLLRALKKYPCKSLIINGRLTEKSLKRYLLWPSIWRQLRPDKVLAISQADAARFAQLFGKDGVKVMSNIKFDRIASTKSGDGDTDAIKTIVPADIPFAILASVRSEEESLVKKIIQEVLHIRPQIVIGLFPRHMHRIQYWQETLNLKGIRWSLRSGTETQAPAGSVVLWDTFGELLPAYRHAKTAFIGGSLAPLGGQNFLEALVSGVIPISGPSWENFAWVGSEIIDSGLLRLAGDWKEVAALLLKDLDRSPCRQDVIAAALDFINARRGGTEKACRHIADCLESNSIHKPPAMPVRI